jgi:hypothetical protein
VALVVDQYLNSIAFGETRYETFPMLEGPTNQIVGDPNIQRAAPTVGEDVDPKAH